MKVLTYENMDIMRPLIDAAKLACEEGEFVIYRRPFRWKHDCGAEEVVLPNCYEMFGIDGVCETAGLELIHDFNHFGIVRKK